MSKKTRTPTQNKRTYKFVSKSLFVGQFLAVAAPYLVIGGVRFNDYFIEYDGIKMSIASVIAFVVMGVAIWCVAKKKLQATYVGLIVGFAIFDGILWLIDEIVYDMKYIVLFGIIGLFIAFGLEKGSEKADEKAKKIQEGIELAERENTRDAYQQELADKEQKKVRIKIKK